MLSTSDKITITNASALLDECVTNLDLGEWSLLAWAFDARSLIERTVKDLDWLLEADEYD